jgi:hypothetical protein
MPFFDFRQNNSGGSFVADHVAGISLTVIVEADDASHANERAEMIGLYFDGAGDCSCCGDRWHSKWGDDKGDPVPSIYGEPVQVGKPHDEMDFAVEDIGGKGQPTAYIHYLSGLVEPV